MKTRNTQKDILKASRRKSRQEEIDLHGKQITFRTTKTKSKKVYDRQSSKRAVVDDGSFSSKIKNAESQLN